MSDKKLEVIKNLQQAEAIYVIMSGFTKMPYVACDEETFDDKVFVYFEEEPAKEAGKKLLDAVNPEGTLYIAAGSATGSKFYTLNTTKQYYLAERSNTPIPTFSTIDVSADELTIKTYDYDGNKYANDVTIQKNDGATSIIEEKNEVESIDADAITSGSKTRLEDAVNAVNSVLDSRDDSKAIGELTQKFNTAEDPVNYSITPVMEKLKEAYLKVNPSAEIEIQESDSTTGMTSVADGICDIGMASREVKEEELAKGLKATVIATDGIAVIVNKANTLDDITSDQVKSIYVGDALSWDEIIK